MKRVGKRGEGKWERISWDQALDEIAEKLAEIRDRHGPEAVQTMGGSYKGAGDSSCWRWSNLWGTPNILYQGKNCGEAELLANGRSMASRPDRQRRRSRASPSAWCCGASAARMALASQRKNLKAFKAAGGKLIVIDPCRTELTDMADIWLQIRPGTDGALAYGMINTIISEGLLRQAEFVAQLVHRLRRAGRGGARPSRPKKWPKSPGSRPKMIVAAARMYRHQHARPHSLRPRHGRTRQGDDRGGVRQDLSARDHRQPRCRGRLALRRSSPTSTRFREEMHWDKLIDHPLRTRDNISAEHLPDRLGARAQGLSRGHGEGPSARRRAGDLQHGDRPSGAAHRDPRSASPIRSRPSSSRPAIRWCRWPMRGGCTRPC